MKSSDYVLLYIVCVSFIYASVGIMMEAYAGAKTYGTKKTIRDNKRFKEAI